MSVTRRTFLILLLFIPISLAAHFLEWGALSVFITSALAILPLAAWMGEATEEIAVVAGPTLGGLLNATFGNATELIIALIALNAGLVNVVKAVSQAQLLATYCLSWALLCYVGVYVTKSRHFCRLWHV